MGRTGASSNPWVLLPMGLTAQRLSVSLSESRGFIENRLRPQSSDHKDSWPQPRHALNPFSAEINGN